MNVGRRTITSMQGSSELHITSGSGGQTQLPRVNQEQQYLGKTSRHGEAGPDTPKQESVCQLFSPSVNRILGAPCSPAHHAEDHSLPSPAPCSSGARKHPTRGANTDLGRYNAPNQPAKSVITWYLCVSALRLTAHTLPGQLLDSKANVDQPTLRRSPAA